MNKETHSHTYTISVIFKGVYLVFCECGKCYNEWLMKGFKLSVKFVKKNK